MFLGKMCCGIVAMSGTLLDCFGGTRDDGLVAGIPAAGGTPLMDPTVLFGREVCAGPDLGTRPLFGHTAKKHSSQRLSSVW